MKPVNFEEANKNLTKPGNMTDEECRSLPVWTDGKVCISCWQLSEAEIQELVNTSQIWVEVHSGQTQPPISVRADSPFRPASETPDLLPPDQGRKTIEVFKVTMLDDSWIVFPPNEFSPTEKQMELVQSINRETMAEEDYNNLQATSHEWWSAARA